MNPTITSSETKAAMPKITFKDELDAKEEKTKSIGVNTNKMVRGALSRFGQKMRFCAPHFEHRKPF